MELRVKHTHTHTLRETEAVNVMDEVEKGIEGNNALQKYSPPHLSFSFCFLTAADLFLDILRCS